MKIRLMKISDYDQVMAVWKAASLVVDEVSDSREMIEKLLELNPDSCFVAEVGGKVVGAVLGTFNGRRAWVYHLGVLPEYQLQGIGTALLEAAEEACRRQGAPKVLLGVSLSNLKAISFYENLGFSVVNDALWLKRSLKGGGCDGK